MSVSAPGMSPNPGLSSLPSPGGAGGDGLDDKALQDLLASLGGPPPSGGASGASAPTGPDQSQSQQYSPFAGADASAAAPPSLTPPPPIASGPSQDMFQTQGPDPAQGQAGQNVALGQQTFPGVAGQPIDMTSGMPGFSAPPPPGLPTGPAPGAYMIPPVVTAPGALMGPPPPPPGLSYLA